ncbi:hypothetical protein ASG63_20470 [Methylobacterium sp. Leaf94]|uniref:hypothetical protein n=1 Tax=Methylobacterium sp. Leaf94 TaxID=1736250 RepID=UPI0006FEC526|nr:hypothetical protein [Methylobacterium sp. Leaf94]KQU25488.1 hypothetical protein ASG63_20470 [Methylobacterium sp. Leaf94]
MRTDITLANAAPTLPPGLLTLPSIGLTPPPAIILYGRDEKGRPHSSKFAGDMTDEAEAAARLMGFRFAAADTDALRDLATCLPAGRLFSSGKGFVPFVKTSLYERLLAATGTADKPMPMKAHTKPADGGGAPGAGQGRGGGGAGAGDPPATRAGAKAPASLSEVGLGSFVLAQGDEGDEGYYAAKVLATKTPDSFVLQWAGYSDLPEFVRPRGALGLLPPEAAVGLA